MARITGSSTVEIAAPIEDVWAVVEDVLIAPDWQGGLKDMEEIERDGEGRVTLAESSSDAKVRTIKSIVRFSYDAPTRLHWRQEEGEMKSIEGSWSSRILVMRARVRPIAWRSSSAACSAW